MKKLLILPLLVLLTGCVSYYYPETALEDGVYYAEDDPSYVVYSAPYSGVAYYPWYTLDYFYMGYYPYPGFSIGYGYPSGFSIGLSYAFSPWYYPSHYYGYYSPWYGSHYHHHYAYHPAWRPYRGYHSDHRGDRNKKHRRDDRYARHDRNDRDDQYYGNERYDRRDMNDRRNRSDDKEGRDDYASERRRQEQPDRNRSSSVRRYVSTAPSGHSGNRGVVIRSRDSTKVGKSRLHVDQSSTTTTNKTKSAQPQVIMPDYSVNRGANEVRYRSNAKQTPSRTTPASPSASAKGVVVKAAPVKSTRGSSGNTRQKTVVRAPAPPKTSSPSRSKASSSGKRSSRASHSSSKGRSSRSQDRK